MTVLLLTGRDVAALMTSADYLSAVETAFRLSKEGRAPSPPPMHIPGTGSGAFHAKGAALQGERKLVALKLNGNFPDNAIRGLPTIQGVIVLCDAENGTVLALMDSIEITLRRTAAASALAAKHLARKDARTLSVIGCGAQARPQVEALADVLQLHRGVAWDIDTAKADTCSAELGRALGIPFERAPSLHAAARAGDVIVTCTTARSPFLTLDDVSPGTFIAAVGADNPEKSELEPNLMAKAKVVVDVLDQCLVMGDLHHAVNAGAMTTADVYADLGDIVTGAKPGRLRPEEIIVFDSTGTAIQDVTSAAQAFQRAVESGLGIKFSFK